MPTVCQLVTPAVVKFLKLELGLIKLEFQLSMQS